jgi:F-type H+-transporting ATPase subunit alpha
MADHYVIAAADFKEDLAEEKDAVNGKVYIGPLAKDDAEKDLKSGQKGKIVKVKGTGGSLTALPIIETLLGDVSAYVPTNVISITDGQIYLENDLFYSGIRPAINAGISVSRVGGDAQLKAMKQVAGQLRLDMAAFRELAAFAQFGSDLDKATQARLDRGRRLREILKQPQFAPVPVANQIVVIYAATKGYADKVQLADMAEWEQELVRYIENSHPDLLKSILKEKQITEKIEAALKDALEAFLF